MEFRQLGEHKYLDIGSGEPALLLHGLFGRLSNWNNVTNFFSNKYRVIIPILPIHDMPRREATILGLSQYVEKFVLDMGLDKMHVIGNSLGGHIGMQFTLRHPEKVQSLVLTGSSGLFESGMGESYPRRNYEYVEERVGYTFYDPQFATKEMVDEVHEIVNNLQKCIRIITVAKSAQRENMTDVLPEIKTPTCLIWGLNDTITPPMVAHEFNRLIKNSELHFIDKCCHVAMMEHPDKFNNIIKVFLEKHAFEV